MRQVQQLEIKVGLLVLAGLVVSIAMVLTADKFRIERTYQVSAYLQDAGGLRYESPVTLSGIAVGKVKGMESVPPGQLAPGKVRARIEIYQGVVLPADVEARLATSGVFGDSSLALAAPAKPSGALLPVDGSGLVVVQAGFIDRAVDKAGGILTAVEDLLDAPTRADAKRLVANAADLAGHAASVAKRLDAEQERVVRILDNLERATTRLDHTIAGLDQRLGPLLDRADGTFDRVDALLASARQTSERAQELIGGVDRVVGHVDQVLGANEEHLTAVLTGIAGAARKVQDLAALLEGGEGILGQLLVNRELAGDLQRLAVDVESAARQIADKPSRLVFDDSDAARRQEQLKRDREKMRRTLAEGLGAPLPADKGADGKDAKGAEVKDAAAEPAPAPTPAAQGKIPGR